MSKIVPKIGEYWKCEFDDRSAIIQVIEIIDSEELQGKIIEYNNREQYIGTTHCWNYLDDKWTNVGYMNSPLWKKLEGQNG